VFLIEIPDGYMMPYIDPPMPILDYHQKHVNHFVPAVLDKLFEQYGFMRVYTHSGSTPCYFGWHYRVVYRRNVPEVIYQLCKMKTHDAIENKIAKMRKIDGPVIVWGCGDLCLHMLTKIKLDVKYYVDNDPAYMGATIDGVPVYNILQKSQNAHRYDRYPIVIIAQNQASGILKRIKRWRFKNEVIVI
jgi:FlaA1/EpsC-like NDP-sugar epimerase